MENWHFVFKVFKVFQVLGVFKFFSFFWILSFSNVFGFWEFSRNELN